MKHAIAAVKAVILDDGSRILSIKQNILGHRLLDLPGGKVDFSEAPEEALKREVREEVGLEVDITSCLGAWWFYTLKNERREIVCTTFLCSLKEDDPSIGTEQNPSEVERGETEGIEWLTKEEFLDPKWHENRENDSLTKLIEGLHV